MSTIILEISDSDKYFMKIIADFEGISLSELIRTKILEVLEDQYDARIVDLSYSEYQEGLKKEDETSSLSEAVEELSFDLLT